MSHSYRSHSGHFDAAILGIPLYLNVRYAFRAVKAGRQFFKMLVLAIEVRCNHYDFNTVTCVESGLKSPVLAYRKVHSMFIGNIEVDYKHKIRLETKILVWKYKRKQK